MRNLITLLFVVFSGVVFSQDINIQNGTFTQCSGIFTDSGGAAGNYGLNENFTMTICPEIPGDKVMLDFTTFDTRNPVDFMQIFNGPDINAPTFGVFTGNTTAIPNIVSATDANPSGCLTITFVSGGVGTPSMGWSANISCFEPCQTITSQIDNAVPMPNADGYIRVCPNEDIMLTGSGIFSNDGAGATYEWDLGDGNTVVGQTATFSYDTPGVYLVNLNIRDSNTTVNPLGCPNSNILAQVVQVGTLPDFTGTSAVDTSVCLGDDVAINGVVNAVEFNVDCTPPVGDLTPLPDGTGISYETFISVDCYDDGLTITNVNQIEAICINMEHSYAGDLDIFIISPSGQIAQLFDQAGDGIYFGAANNNDDDVPGVGAEYCFSMNAAIPLGNAPTVMAGTNPPFNSYVPGTYLPVGNFSTLLGSPLNGNWTIRITDNLAADNGTIFSWNMELDSTLLPAELSFEPIITSETWDADPTITNTTGNTITVAPPAPGNYCYTFRVTDDFGCEYTEEVCIDVLPEIITTLPSNLFICDPGAAPYIFDLTQNTPIVTSSTPNPTDLNVSYYESLANAETETAAIADPMNYSGTPGQTIYVRVEYLTSDCFKTESFTLNLTNAPIINTVPDLEVCDDASNDGVGEAFDLDSQIAAILGAQPDTDFTVTFYLSVADASTKQNALVSPYNNTVNNEPIFVRVELNSNVACFLVSPTALFNLVVNPLDDSTFTTSSDCDGGTVTIAGTPGGTFSFNPAPTDGAVLDPVTGTVTGGTLGETYSIEYTTNGICPTTTNLPLTAASPLDPSFTVEPTCDGGIVTITGDTGGVFSFNPVPTDGAVIDAMTGEVTNGGVGVTYTIQYEIALPCLALQTQDVTVIPLPPVIVATPLVACDEATPGDLAFFDLESKSNEINGGNNAYTVTYYDTPADATNGVNPLVSPYLSRSRTVYVRVQDLGVICFITTTLELVVSPLPTITTAPYSLCDDNMELDGDPSNDSVAFDLESQNPAILNGQDPMNFTVSYYLNQADADAGINQLVSPYENVTNPQTIIVRVDNDTMVDDGAGTPVDSSLCYVTDDMVLEVNPMPSFDLLDNYTLCVNLDGTEVVDPPIIDTGLNAANYTFVWYLDGNVIPDEDGSNLSPAQGGMYSVTVTDNISGCSTVVGDPNTVTEVNESTRPILSASQVTLAFVENNTILATATPSIDTLINGNAAYEFSLDGGQWVHNTPNNGTYTFENVGAGQHTVEARDINGCGITSVIVNVLDYPPYFTPNGDGFHDTWNIVGIASQPDAKIYIYNRYGKLIKQISPVGLGWDGTYNGKLMPSDDYWFRLEYTEPLTATKNEFKAHFSLKR